MLGVIVALILVAVVVYFFFIRETPQDLRGKTVLITGGGSGIGRKQAFRFAKEGCRLVLWDLRQEFLEKVKGEIEEKYPGTKVFTFICDVSRPAIVYKMAEETKKEAGVVDILVNNAGIVIGKPILDLKDEQIVRTFEVNTLAHFWTLKSFLPGMMERNYGHVVTIASIAGVAPAAGLSDYCASKFAAVGLHDCLRLELVKYKKQNQVGTSLIMPYYINTGMFQGVATSLLPTLNEDMVADAIVDAVIYKRLQVFIPSVLEYIYISTRLMSVKMRDYVATMFGAADSMDSFKGRGVEYAMQSIPHNKTD